MGRDTAGEDDNTFDSDVDRFRRVRSIELFELFLSVGCVQGFGNILVGGLHDACARFRIGVPRSRLRRVWWRLSQEKVGEGEHREQSASVYRHNVGVGHVTTVIGRASMDSDQYLSRLEGFLATPLPKSLLAAHPNDVANPSFALPPEWEAWWDWAASASVTEPWIELLGYYVVPSNLGSYAQAYIPFF